MAAEALFDHVNATFHRPRWAPWLEPAESAAHYEAILRSIHPANHPPDLVLLGLGDDGHTASLFPGHRGPQGGEAVVCRQLRPQVGHLAPDRHISVAVEAPGRSSSWSQARPKRSGSPRSWMAFHTRPPWSTRPRRRSPGFSTRPRPVCCRVEVASAVCALALLLVGACSSPSGHHRPRCPPMASETTGTAPTTTTVPENTIGLDLVGGLPVEVFGPPEVGDYPVVVMFHGGGWFGGSPASMEPLADYLASNGIVVFNSTYRTSAGGYPESFDDVACDIRFALSKAPEYTTSTGPLTVVAHSAGAHIAVGGQPRRRSIRRRLRGRRRRAGRPIRGSGRSLRSHPLLVGPAPDTSGPSSRSTPPPGKQEAPTPT